MTKMLDHAYLDPAERIQIERLVFRYRKNQISAQTCKSQLSQLGYEDKSVEHFFELLQSTCMVINARF